MSNLTEDQKTALDEFNQIGDVLAVPTMGKPLPANRQWTLPDLDKKALADLPKDEKAAEAKEQAVSVQATPAAGESQTGESYIKDPPKQTGRK